MICEFYCKAVLDVSSEPNAWDIVTVYHSVPLQQHLPPCCPPFECNKILTNHTSGNASSQIIQQLMQKLQLPAALLLKHSAPGLVDSAWNQYSAWHQYTPLSSTRTRADHCCYRLHFKSGSGGPLVVPHVCQ